MGRATTNQQLSRPVTAESSHDGTKPDRNVPHSDSPTRMPGIRPQQQLATPLSREPLAVRSSGDVETLVAEEILDAARVIALELYLPVLDSATAGELRFEV